MTFPANFTVELELLSCTILLSAIPIKDEMRLTEWEKVYDSCTLHIAILVSNRLFFIYNNSAFLQFKVVSNKNEIHLLIYFFPNDSIEWEKSGCRASDWRKTFHFPTVNKVCSVPVLRFCKTHEEFPTKSNYITGIPRYN